MNTSFIGAPPTDNLYKFVALVGSLLVIVSLAYPAQLIDEADLKIVETRGESDKLSHTADFLTKRVELAIKRAKMGKLSAEEELDLHKSRMELLNAQTAVKTSTDKLQVLISHARRYTNAACIGSFLGLFLAWFGFRNWYTKVQLPADKKAQQADSA